MQVLGVRLRAVQTFYHRRKWSASLEDLGPWLFAGITVGVSLRLFSPVPRRSFESALLAAGMTILVAAAMLVI